MIGCVYCLRWRGNPRMYIGVDGRCPNGSQRYKDHLLVARRGGGYAVHNAIRKYGAPHKAILFRSADYDLLLCVERELVDEFGTYCDGLNMTLGGDMPPSKCPKTAARITNTRRAAYYASPQFKKKIETQRLKQLRKTDITAWARAIVSKAGPGLKRLNLFDRINIELGQLPSERPS